MSFAAVQNTLAHETPAQEAPAQEAPAQEAPSQDVRVTMTKADCSRLVKHVPDGSVAYQPGVDAHGRKVAPADLNGGIRIDVPETITIPIEVNLFARFGIPVDPTQYQADAAIGDVVVHKDGRAFFNGQPLQDEEAAELAARCQEVLRGGE